MCKLLEFLFKTVRITITLHLAPENKTADT